MTKEPAFRKVKFKVYSRATFDFVVFDGVFHQWGNEYEEFEAGPGNQTVGIVETDDGQIFTPKPQHITFINSNHQP